jgi:hypothetical protein
MLNKLLPALLLLMMSGCSGLNGQSENSRKSTGVDMKKNTLSPQSGVKNILIKPGRPPLLTLEAEVSLKNPLLKPVWFILPLNLPETPGGVDVVEVFTVQGNGKAEVLKMLGTGGFQTLLVPAESEILLKNFHFSFWGDPPSSGFQINVKTAENILLDGKPLKEFLGTEPLCDKKVEADFTSAKMHFSFKPANGKEVPYTLKQ